MEKLCVGYTSSWKKSRPGRLMKSWSNYLPHLSGLTVKSVSTEHSLLNILQFSAHFKVDAIFFILLFRKRKYNAVKQNFKIVYIISSGIILFSLHTVTVGFLRQMAASSKNRRHLVISKHPKWSQFRWCWFIEKQNTKYCKLIVVFRFFKAERKRREEEKKQWEFMVCGIF